MITMWLEGTGYKWLPVFVKKQDQQKHITQDEATSLSHRKSPRDSGHTVREKKTNKQTNICINFSIRYDSRRKCTRSMELKLFSNIPGIFIKIFCDNYQWNSYLSRNISGSGGYVLISGTRSCTMTMTKEVNPKTKNTYMQLTTVFHTSGSNRPANCWRLPPLECTWHNAAPVTCPHLSLFLNRSSVPLHKWLFPLNPLLSVPSQLQFTPSGVLAGRASESRRPSSSSWAWFCFWSRWRAMVNLFMSPSTVRPSGGPRRSASVRASRLSPSRRCCVHNNSTYSPKPSSWSHWATLLQLHALTLSPDCAMLLETQTQTEWGRVGWWRRKWLKSMAHNSRSGMRAETEMSSERHEAMLSPL